MIFNLISSKKRTITAPSGTPSVSLQATKVIAAHDGSEVSNGGWYGRASVVVRYGITILTYREGALHFENTYGRCHIRFSDDYGQTWSDENKYLDGSSVSGFPLWPTSTPYGTSDAGPVHALLTLCPNGDLIAHQWSSSYSGGFNDGAWQARSMDGGKTWINAKVTFQNIPGTVTDSDTLYFGEDRTVVGNTIYAGVRNYEVASPQIEENFCAKSTDNGVTWSIIGRLTTLSNPSPRGTQEMSLEYIGGTRMISVLREAYNDDGWICFSDDMGVTWSSPQLATGLFGLTSGQGIGRTIINTRYHIQGKGNWQNDPVLICCGFALMSTPGSSQRRNACWISKDKGINWNGPFWLDDQGYDGGYGDFIYDQNRDEYVFISYRSPTSYYDASLKQYNFKIIWS
jgi:hypothetical protein